MPVQPMAANDYSHVLRVVPMRDSLWTGTMGTPRLLWRAHAGRQPHGECRPGSNNCKGSGHGGPHSRRANTARGRGGQRRHIGCCPGTAGGPRLSGDDFRRRQAGLKLSRGGPTGFREWPATSLPVACPTPQHDAVQLLPWTSTTGMPGRSSLLPSSTGTGRGRPGVCQ